MEKFDVFMVIVTVVTFLIAITGPIIKLNTTIVKLNDAVDMLKTSFEDIIEKNKKSHEKIWTKLDDHEDRLKVIEKKEG